MKAKLIKLNVGVGYRLDDENGNLIATTLTSSKTNLSLKNCEAIERGYDLGEMIAKKVNDSNIVDKAVEFSNANSKNNGAYLAYIAGAYEMAKQLEILGDKKFSEDDILKAYNQGEEDCYKSGAVSEKRNKYIKSLQQTEWDCIVEMEEIQEIYRDGTTKYERVPKLDAGGCIVLKRK